MAFRWIRNEIRDLCEYGLRWYYRRIKVALFGRPLWCFEHSPEAQPPMLLGCYLPECKWHIDLKKPHKYRIRKRGSYVALDPQGRAGSPK